MTNHSPNPAPLPETKAPGTAELATEFGLSDIEFYHLNEQAWLATFLENPESVPLDVRPFAVSSIRKELRKTQALSLILSVIYAARQLDDSDLINTAIDTAVHNFGILPLPNTVGIAENKTWFKEQIRKYVYG